MKKEYIHPAISIHRIEGHEILQSSVTGTSVFSERDDDSDNGSSGFTGLTRSNSLWDDDDE